MTREELIQKTADLGIAEVCTSQDVMKKSILYLISDEVDLSGEADVGYNSPHLAEICQAWDALTDEEFWDYADELNNREQSSTMIKGRVGKRKGRPTGR